MPKRNKIEQKRLKRALINRYGYVDMLTGQTCFKTTLHHINWKRLDNSYENGSLLSEKSQRLVHSYNVDSIEYQMYAEQIRQYKATH